MLMDLSYEPIMSPYSELDAAFRWKPEDWSLNVSQLDLKTISPLAKLFPDSKQVSQLLETISIGGLLKIFVYQ